MKNAELYRSPCGVCAQTLHVVHRIALRRAPIGTGRERLRVPLMQLNNIERLSTYMRCIQMKLISRKSHALWEAIYSTTCRGVGCEGRLPLRPLSAHKNIPALILRMSSPLPMLGRWAGCTPSQRLVALRALPRVDLPLTALSEPRARSALALNGLLSQTFWLASSVCLRISHQQARFISGR